MKFLFILSLLIFFKVKLTLAGEETEISKYFESDTFKTIQNQWQVERKSFENAIALILEQNYVRKEMNLYVRSLLDACKISGGFFFSDDVVNVVLLEMRLQDLPYLIAPDVVFALASNYLSIAAKLSKIIINTDYILIRNQSDIVFSGPDHDFQMKSPFSFQQVQESGKLTIVADDCSLVGQTITSLNAETVNLGHDTFKLTNCQFTIEIYSPGLGSPPVIAPYFSKQQGLALENLITNPIRAKLMPKLQATVFSYVNTSAIFGEKLPELRSHQNAVFKQTTTYMNILVRNFIKNNIKNNQGILQLKPLEVSWSTKCSDGSCRTYAKLKDVILYGLDTAYSAQSGGPYNRGSVKIAEAIRFGTLQVRGKLDFQNATTKGVHEFAVELRDVAINVVMEAKSGSFSLVPTKVDLVGWRTIEFSILDFGIFAYERRTSQSFITGYLINEIPKRLLDQFMKSFGDDNDREQSSSVTVQDKQYSVEHDDIKNKPSVNNNENNNNNENENDDDNVNKNENSSNNENENDKKNKNNENKNDSNNQNENDNNENDNEKFTNSKELSGNENSDSGVDILIAEEISSGDEDSEREDKILHPSDNEV